MGHRSAGTRPKAESCYLLPLQTQAIRKISLSCIPVLGCLNQISHVSVSQLFCSQWLAGNQSSRHLCLYTPNLSHKPSSHQWGKPTLISYPQLQPEVPMAEITYFIGTPFIQIRTCKPGSFPRVHAWLPLPGWHAGRQDPGLTAAFLKPHWNTKPTKCPGKKKECGAAGSLWSNNFGK